MDPLLLTMLAHLSAHRRLLINLYTCGFLDDPRPVDAARVLRETFAKAPTQAPEGGSGLDPATSDLLAAMTDEAIEDIMNRVVLRLEETCHSDIRPGATQRRARAVRLSGAERR